MAELFAVPASTVKGSTETDILCLQITMCLYGLAIPILLYYTWKYNKFRTASCIKSRRPNITIVAEFIILCMFMNRIVLCADAIYSEKILRIIFVLTYPIANHSVLWICLIKYWLLYYDIQFVLFSEGNQWKTHINRHNVTYHTNWYVLNKSHIGNERYLLCKIFIIILIPSLLIPLATFFQYTNKYSLFIGLFLMIIPLILITIIWYKTPKYLDYFRVREECRMLVIIGSALIIVYLIFGCITLIFERQNQQHIYFILEMCIEYTYLFGVFIGGLHLTFWTISKNKHRLNVNQKASKLYLHYRTLNRVVSNRNKISQTQQTIAIQRRLSSNASEQPRISQMGQNDTILLLISILENEHGFQMFLSHLLTEFCLESALAIIELTQYQMLMKQIYGNNESQLKNMDIGRDDEYKLNEFNILRLPQIIPQSIIVYDPQQKNDIFDVKNIARKLLEKYIVNQSEFEINISYKLKKKLLTDLSNIDELDEMKLIHLFDESIQSLLFLLNDSLARFVKTAKYKQIEKELAEEYINNQNNQNNNVVKSNDYIKVHTPQTTMDSPRAQNAIISPASPDIIDNDNEINNNELQLDDKENEPIITLPPHLAQIENNNNDKQPNFAPLESTKL